MTEEEELRRAFVEAKQRIEESGERVRQELERVKEGRKRMLALAGIQTVKEPDRQ